MNLLPCRTVVTAVLLLSALPLFGCASSPTSEEEATGSSAADLIGGRAGAVYTESNDATSNEVIVFRRAADGSLQRAATYATTGKGSGDGLGSQGAVVLSGDRRWLFAVNAGSNELSVFRVYGEVLYLVDTVATGGTRPISVTEHEGLVYVAHAGGGGQDQADNNNITGFVQRYNGTLAALPGSSHALSGVNVGPAQVQFSPSGRALIVTEKMTNKVDELRIDPYAGTPVSFTAHDSNGQTPFGFAITQHGQVVVSEAVGGADGASTVSSYQLDGHAGLATVSASVADTESAACWIALARGDRFAYTTNTKSGSISSYAVTSAGALSLIAPVAANTGTDSKPIDMAVSQNDRFLYVLESRSSSVGVTRIEADGSLTLLPTSVNGLPANAAGLAAE